MVKKLATDHSLALSQELRWLSNVLVTAFGKYFNPEAETGSIYEIQPPSLEGATGFFADFLRKNDLSFTERLILILSITPHLEPALLDPLLVKNPDTDRAFTEFGGKRTSEITAFFPTIQTAIFMLDDGNIARRIAILELFEEGHLFHQEGILSAGQVSADEPRINAPLNINPDFLDQILSGRPRIPKFGMSFPAKVISTRMEWEDLVLDHAVMAEIEDLLAWLKYNKQLMEDWGLAKKIKPGYRTLFFGPPGTGKTLTATLLGKRTGLPVFRIDLSMVVSKYIGETEKNLGRVFSAAENKDWILFFDEADALFGKRTKVSDSHDRYANQEVSYLLQRVEEYKGLVILATNLKSNMDEAFYRRFQSIIQFPMPAIEERLRLWETSFSPKTQFGEDVNLRQIAANYELSGGAIVNVVQYCSLMALKNEQDTISHAHIINGIRKELHKEGKSM